jgi:hypothetical protein
MTEHAGGGGNYEWSEGVAHPLTDPFNTLGKNNPLKSDCYSMDDMTMALGSVVNWITNDGNFQQRGVYNRAMTLGFVLQAPELGLDSQADLGRKLNLSRQQTNELVRSFTDSFGVKTTAQRIHPQGGSER